MSAGRRARRRRPALAAAAAALALCAGCASLEPVQPWQKGELARPEMRFDAGGGLESHVYASREAASGGERAGGGGCGCR